MMMDELEEQRMLHISEWNFRNIVKRKLQNLLLCKQEYWKKRCTARWAKLGDENTSFFHSMATIRYRKILSLPFLGKMVRLLWIIMKRLVFFGIPSSRDWE
jgi:hypothetical protein